jgi:hypothetical protein
VNSGAAVYQVNRVRRFYDGFAAERSLALLDSCYTGREVTGNQRLQCRSP